MSATRVAEIELCRFARPYDWNTIDATVHDEGGAILESLFCANEVGRFNHEIDHYLRAHEDAGRPRSGSSAYDKFLGYRTVRLHGLIEKFESAAGWIGRRELVDWAGRAVEPVATSILLNTAELIQIGPGEPEQYLHRDSDSWPMAPLGGHPLVMNVIMALDPFTLENGATHVTPGSWRWDRGRKPSPDEISRAIMEAGEALIFRGDIVHGGGANTTDRPRRAVSISYCAGWLRPVENSILNVSKACAKTLPKHVQGLLGYAAYDGTRNRGGLVGLFENGDPGAFLED